MPRLDVETDLASSLFLLGAAPDVSASAAAEIEGQVMSLFDELRGPLLRYVLSFGIPLHDGEEIVQESFLALFRHLQLRRPRGNLSGWLFRVAHNLALKQRGAAQRGVGRVSWDDSLADRYPDPSPTPEEQVSFNQGKRRFAAILDALSDRDRSCLRLRAEGLPYREIARVLGISLGAVSLSLSRSLARFLRANER